MLVLPDDFFSEKLCKEYVWVCMYTYKHKRWLKTMVLLFFENGAVWISWYFLECFWDAYLIVQQWDQYGLGSQIFHIPWICIFG